MNICIIGAGNLGLALAKGLKAKDLTDSKITITRKTQNFSVDETRDFNCMIDNKEAVKKAEIVVLSVRPNQIEDLAKNLNLTPPQLIISTVTGVTIDKLETLFGSDKKIARVMPNLALSTGNSMTCMALNEKGLKQTDFVEKIFNSLGETLVINEDMFPQATVLCGSGIAIVSKFIRGFMQAGIQNGFNEHDSLKIARQVMAGAVSLLIDGKHPEKLVDDITTPSGTTITTMSELEHRGFISALLKAIRVGIKKAKHMIQK